MSRLNLRKRKRVCYYEPEEPPFDEYIFCTECRDYVYEYCSIHGPLLVIPDDKVPSRTGYPPLVPRAALTVPRAFLHLAASRIPDAGIGVFSSMTLPIGVRFGPYRGVRLPPGPGSYYGWQIVDANHKPSHIVDAADASGSNWMRYVNCSRHHSEQNLVAFQYQGQLYYRTVKVIPRFTELLVFYGSEFARELGVDLRAYRAPCPCEHCQAQLPQKSTTIKTRKHQIQNVEKPRDNIAIVNPVDKVQDTQITSDDTQKDSPTNKPVLNQAKSKKNIFKSKTIFKCDKCNKIFKIKTELEIHLNTHALTEVSKINDSLPNSEKCDKCRESFDTKTDLEKHLKSHIPTNNELVGNKSSCKSCSAKFDTKTILLEHMKSQHDVECLACTECDYKTIEKHCLVQHRKKHTGEKPYKCEICEYKLAYSHNLKRHLMSVHAGVKPFKCSHCSYTCSQKSDLLTHERTHTGEKPYKCSHCSYTCSQKSDLLTHERTHTGEKPYKCSHCSYTCSHKGHLLRHERTHTGEKPYKCSHCSYTCSQKSDLLTHERTHTGEKPYKCSHCSYTCSHKGHLLRHERTHTGEKPYKCSHCSYTCNQNCHLLTHERTHSGEKPYKCDMCDYKTAYSKQLKKHVMMNHSVVKL